MIGIPERQRRATCVRPEPAQARGFAPTSMVARFGVVGVVATLLHTSVVWCLVALGGIGPFPANLLAFSVAFFVSFTGHYHWTFRTQRRWGRSLGRFFLISVGGFALNNLILAILLRWDQAPASASVVISALAIPVLSFVASRLWAFR